MLLDQTSGRRDARVVRHVEWDAERVDAGRPQLIALGKTIAVLPESAQVLARTGHAVVPVVDAPRVTTVIAWPPQSTARALAALVRTATRL